jgi:acid phosphatase
MPGMRAANLLRSLSSILLGLFALNSVERCFAQIPTSDHVFILVGENHAYSQIVGSSSMPYLNSLIAANGLATNYDANSHYSIPNYFWLTTGSYVTLHDATTAVFDVDNVTRYLAAAGKTWKAYEESIPSAGYLGPTVEPYEKNHNPFSYFTDVVNSSQKMNIVPFTQLATDIANDQLPNFALIVPDSSHDGHSGTLAAMDGWLKTSIGPLLATAEFGSGGNALLFLTFDESRNSDCLPLAVCPKLPENGGGGHVATVVIGPTVIAGTRSATFYQHPSVLRTALSALGIAGAPGAAQNAPAMLDFFPSASSGCAPGPINQTMTICTPTSGQSVGSPVHITAAASSTTPVKYSQVYVDGVKKYTTTSANIDTFVTLSVGTHKLTVKASNGTLFGTTIYFAVQ